jgi:hypothetical protein
MTRRGGIRSLWRSKPWTPPNSQPPPAGEERGQRARLRHLSVQGEVVNRGRQQSSEEWPASDTGTPDVLVNDRRELTVEWLLGP